MKKQNGKSTVEKTTFSAAGDFHETPVNPKQKDTLFRMIFHEKEELLCLYNAVNGTFHTDTSILEIITLENAIYLNVKNDLAFLLTNRINMYEHQSTLCPNLPLRDLFYIASEYEKLVSDKSLYSNTLVKLPTPNFLVFYNGQESAPERSVLRLSDAFEVPVDDPELELKVTVLNINPGNNSKLLDCCPPLKEYMLYIEKVRTYAKTLSIQEAVWQSVQECIHEGILTKFLTKYRNEAIRMSIFECDVERELKLIRQDEYNAGLSQGRTEGLMKGRTEGRTEGRAEGQTEGFRQAKSEGIRYLVDAFRDYGHSDEEIKSVIIAKYQLSEEEAVSYL